MVLDLFKLKDVKCEEIDDPIFEGKCIKIEIGEEEVGRLGILSEKILKKFGIDENGEIGFCDFKMESIVKILKKQKFVEAKNEIKAQKIQRDMSLEVDKKIKFSEILDVIYGLNEEKITDIKLFSVYEDEKLDSENKKVYSISIYFADKNKILDGDEVGEIMQKIEEQYKNKIGAKIR